MGCSFCKHKAISPNYLPLQPIEFNDILKTNDVHLKIEANDYPSRPQEDSKKETPSTPTLVTKRKEFQKHIKSKLSKYLNEWFQDCYGVGGSEYIHFFIFKDIKLMDTEWTKNDNISYDYLQSFWYYSKDFRDDCYSANSDYFEKALQSEYKALDMDIKNVITKSYDITDFAKPQSGTKGEELIFDVLLSVNNPNKNTLKTISEIMISGNTYLSEMVVYGYIHQFLLCPKEINDLCLQYFGTMSCFQDNDKKWNWDKPPFNTICNKWKWRNSYKDKYKSVQLALYNVLYEIVYSYNAINELNENQNKEIKCYFCRGQRNRWNYINHYEGESDSLDLWWINITHKTCLFFRMFRMMSNDY